LTAIPLLSLPGLELLNVLVRFVLEGIAAATATDAIGLALVGDGNGSETAADDALRAFLDAGERHALLRGTNLIDARARCVLRGPHLIAVEVTVGVQQAHDQPLGLLRPGVGALQGEAAPVESALENEFLLGGGRDGELIAVAAGEIAQLSAREVLAP